MHIAIVFSSSDNANNISLMYLNHFLDEINKGNCLKKWYPPNKIRVSDTGSEGVKVLNLFKMNL